MSKQTKNEPQRPADSATHHEDELVHVPKGQSKLRFYLILALTIFVLLIFTVGSQLQGTMSRMFNGGGQILPSLVWTDPDTRERHEVDQRTFVFAKRALQRCVEMGLFQPEPTEENPEGGRASDDEVAMWLIGREKAAQAGIVVTDAEVAERLRFVGFTSGDLLSAWARSQRTTATEIQEDVRQLLVYKKYLALLKSAVAVPDPDKVADLWAEKHPEYSFQYVAVDTADFEDEAAENVPDDEALLAWFRELPEFRQRSYYTEDKVSPAVAWLDLSQPDFDTTALLAKFPRPEDEDPETLAQSYYNQVSNVRFRNEQPDPEELEEGQEPPPLFKSFEEVKELCLKEAPLHAALNDWMADIKLREGAEEAIDFVAEAAEIGLNYEAPTEPLSRSEIEEREGWGGRFVAGQLVFGQDQKFLTRMVVEESAFVVGQVVGKTPGEEPPFAEIREEIAGEWAKEHAREIAVERLTALRDSMGGTDGSASTDDGSDEGATDGSEAASSSDVPPSVDAEAFAAAVAAAGFEAVDRPFLERNAVPDDDVKNATPADLFIRTQGAQPFFDLDVGQVGEARANNQGTQAFLLRLAGKRIADMDRVTPQELNNLRMQVAFESAEDFESRYFDVSGEYAKTRYQISMPWREETGEDL